MIEFYVQALKYDPNLINGEIFNVGYENLKIKEIASLVKKIVKKDFVTETTPSNDNRSYRITSKKIAEKLGLRQNILLRMQLKAYTKILKIKLLLIHLKTIYFIMFRL